MWGRWWHKRLKWPGPKRGRPRLERGGAKIEEGECVEIQD